jgi:hypothetical protein
MTTRGALVGLRGMNGMDTEASAVDDPDPSIISSRIRGWYRPVSTPGLNACPAAFPRIFGSCRAPIERNTKEAAWIKAVAGFMPEAVPSLLAEEAAAGMFAMDYLSPQSFEVWKAQLQRGHVLPTTAAEVGPAIGADSQQICAIPCRRGRVCDRRQMRAGKAAACGRQGGRYQLCAPPSSGMVAKPSGKRRE